LQIGLLHAARGGPAEIELRRYSAALFRAGIRLELSAVEPGLLLQRVRSGDFDLAALGWRGRGGEDPTPLLGGNGRLDRAGGHSARIDSLLERWRRADPGAGREEVARQLAAAVAEELPAIFLYRHDQVLLVHRRVRGLCDEGGRLDLRRVWLQDERR
jgi:ABC-type oligopeptide transport system substrate-binding subunit